MAVTITESTSIDYYINGEGPPLLLISGLGFGRWGWFEQVPAFSRRFRTITFDLRGERGPFQAPGCGSSTTRATSSSSSGSPK